MVKPIEVSGATSTRLTAISSKGVIGELPLELQKFMKKNSEPLKDLDYVQLSKEYPAIFQLRIGS